MRVPEQAHGRHDQALIGRQPVERADQRLAILVARRGLTRRRDALQRRGDLSVIGGRGAQLRFATLIPARGPVAPLLVDDLVECGAPQPRAEGRQVIEARTREFGKKVADEGLRQIRDGFLGGEIRPRVEADEDL